MGPPRSRIEGLLVPGRTRDPLRWTREIKPPTKGLTRPSRVNLGKRRPKKHSIGLIKGILRGVFALAGKR